MNKRIKLNNVEFFAFESKNEIIGYLKNTEEGIIFAVNARKIMTSSDFIKEAISANIGYIDGRGAIWAARRMGYKTKMARIPGVELWLEIIKAFPDKKYYLLGAKDEIVSTTATKLKNDYQGLNIVGFRNGYFTQEELPGIINDLESKKAEIVFVAMGSPKQENIMIEMLKQHKAMYMGLGGSFDVYSGNVKRAPVFFQRLGLEGPYRFISNPKRLFDRQIFYWDYLKNLILGKFHK
jgi:UDP-N-acetyl-D-mannosaminouronate:lipid I N-acetyl-D-mannosaminouronosyltransferase